MTNRDKLAKAQRKHLKLTAKYAKVSEMRLLEASAKAAAELHDERLEVGV